MAAIICQRPLVAITPGVSTRDPDHAPTLRQLVGRLGARARSDGLGVVFEPTTAASRLAWVTIRWLDPFSRTPFVVALDPRDGGSGAGHQLLSDFTSLVDPETRAPLDAVGLLRLLGRALACVRATLAHMLFPLPPVLDIGALRRRLYRDAVLVLAERLDEVSTGDSAWLPVAIGAIRTVAESLVGIPPAERPWRPEGVLEATGRILAWLPEGERGDPLEHLEWAAERAEDADHERWLELVTAGIARPSRRLLVASLSHGAVDLIARRTSHDPVRVHRTAPETHFWAVASSREVGAFVNAIVRGRVPV